MRKKFITGAAVLALLMNAPQVSADDGVVIFGGEFEDGTPSSAPKKAEKPAPKKELPPPIEKPKPPSKPEIVQPKDKAPKQPIEDVVPPNPEIVKSEDKTLPKPVEDINDDDDFGDVLVFNDLNRKPQQTEKPDENSLPPVEINKPFEKPTKPFSNEKPVDEPNIIVSPKTEPQPIAEEKPPRRYFPSSNNNNSQPQSNLKTLKQRFVKLAVDDTYTYYLDKTSVQWKRVPYLANEYMADIWVRMVEHNPKQLDNDMANYGADNFRAEVAFAREQGYQYSPEDLKVLKSQAYVLEHYYLRPKTKQIQFLCELEVFGRPQNAINERAYEYKNWENLVPGSVESAIYAATIKIIGKSKSTERGHMTFIDMLDEYARIALN